MDWMTDFSKLLGNVFDKKEELQSRSKRLNDQVYGVNVDSTLHPYENAVFVRDARTEEIQVRLFYSDLRIESAEIGRTLRAMGEFFRNYPSIQITVAGPSKGDQLQVLCCFSRKMSDQQILTIGDESNLAIGVDHVATLLRRLTDLPRDRLTGETIAQLCHDVARTVVRDTIQVRLDQVRRRYIEQIDEIRRSYPDHVDLLNELCEQYDLIGSQTSPPLSDRSGRADGPRHDGDENASPERADETSGHKVSVHDLVRAGLIAEGEQITWYRRNKQVTYSATVVASGQIRLADGREFDSPSRAAKEVTRGTANVQGWKVWKTSTSQSLDDLRKRLREIEDNQTRPLYVEPTSQHSGVTPAQDTDAQEGSLVPEGAMSSQARTGSSKRVTVLDLMDAGLLSAGDRLRWDRPRKKEIFEATVCESGGIRLSDGREFPSLSAAAVAASGLQTADGWILWCTADGKKVSERRAKYLKQVVR